MRTVSGLGSDSLTFPIDFLWTWDEKEDPSAGWRGCTHYGPLQLLLCLLVTRLLSRTLFPSVSETFFRHHGTFAHTSSFLEKVCFSPPTRLITSVFCFRRPLNPDLFRMLSLILRSRLFSWLHSLAEPCFLLTFPTSFVKSSSFNNFTSHTIIWVVSFKLSIYAFV